MQFVRTITLLVLAGGVTEAAPTAGGLFRDRVAPIFERHCVSCHEGAKPKGGLSLATSKSALAGGESGACIVPGKPDGSLLLEYVSGTEPQMPKESKPLRAEEVAAIRAWIEAGAVWPDDVELVDRTQINLDWWSLLPLDRPQVPRASKWTRTPIDQFVLAKLTELQLSPSSEADRCVLIRRLSFDLLGLPPTPEVVDAFLADQDPQAYEKLVDRFLTSPHYGERWGRHWLDVVHYGDTHGYDKDKIRPHAWPYRDYVIRAFNEDKLYSRFILEQLAGDVLFPETPEGIIATGFIAAGPFDYVGQVEVGEGTQDKAITRNLDRDDMVATTINTFNSMTAQCARCHNHKFDPITQEDYYSLQAIFAGVDRADRSYDLDQAAAEQRIQLAQQIETLKPQQTEVASQMNKLTDGELSHLDRELASLQEQHSNAAFGYHSGIEHHQDSIKWVQFDLGKSTPIDYVVVVGAHDTYGGIGAGFGFPVRFKVELGDDPLFASGVTAIADHTKEDFANPGVRPLRIDGKGLAARYMRITATKLGHRTEDYVLALGEVQLLSPQGQNLAGNATITSLDSIEAPPRWLRTNLIDGYFYEVKSLDAAEKLSVAKAKRVTLLESRVDRATRDRFESLNQSLETAQAQLAALPSKGIVFAAATDFEPVGAFTPTKGKARKVFVLKRGSEKSPATEALPGTCGYLADLDHRFALSETSTEGDRRAALAKWLANRRNPLTWRSIVNRVWQYHFGRGIVDSPNDFGRMGLAPSHPELLDWLATEFRDGGDWIKQPESIKELHRLICKSATYRQSSASNPKLEAIDRGNQYLWRMNRRKLEAEAVRDSVLAVSGKLNDAVGGPGFYMFGFRDDHSPHYTYEDYNPDEPLTHRRSVYRFIVRSVPDPFMSTLDCADSSLGVAKRSETLTALQSLALLNNKFMVRMAEHFADRARTEGNDLPTQIAAAWQLAFARTPATDELTPLVEYANRHGLSSACRLIFNANEFVFID